MTECSRALRMHWCHSVGLRAKQGRGDKSAKAVRPPRHMTRRLVWKTFHWPPGRVPLRDVWVRLCVCFFAQAWAACAHCWYWRLSPLTHFTQQHSVPCWCLYQRMALASSPTLIGVLEHAASPASVSPCSPRRRAPRSGSPKPCPNTPGTPDWGGRGSHPNLAPFHRPPLVSDLVLESKSLRHTEQKRDSYIMIFPRIKVTTFWEKYYNHCKKKINCDNLQCTNIGILLNIILVKLI